MFSVPVKYNVQILSTLLRNSHMCHIMVQTRRAHNSHDTSDLVQQTERMASPPIKRVRLENGRTYAMNRGEDETSYSSDAEPAKQPLGKAKGKAKERAADGFLTRIETPWKIGAHVSCAGGVENAVVNASCIGANAFALFVKAHRKWKSPPLSEHSVQEFKKRMQEFGYEARHVIPHGNYLINLANPDDEKRAKSYECFLDDLKRCEALGLEMYNFHPGSTVGATTLETSISLVAECINRAHEETKGISILLENMAGAGNILGGDFNHLAKIISLVTDKSRVGVCFDTCHAFASGYDIRTREAWDNTIEQFSSIIGLHYLRAIHLNDSICGLSSRKDRHQNIGMGEIGLGGFSHVVSDRRLTDIPMVLETPSFQLPKEVWGVEINVLGRLGLESWDSGMEPDKTAEQGGIELDKLADEIRLAVGTVKPHTQTKRTRKIKSKTSIKGTVVNT